MHVQGVSIDFQNQAQIYVGFPSWDDAIAYFILEHSNI